MKILTTILILCLLVFVIAGCANQAAQPTATNQQPSNVASSTPAQQSSSVATGTQAQPQANETQNQATGAGATATDLPVDNANPDTGSVTAPNVDTSTL